MRILGDGRPWLRAVRRLLNGVAFGVVALGLALARIQVAPDVYFDARNVPIALIALFEGWPAGLVAALPVAIYRWFWLGGCYWHDHPVITAYEGEGNLLEVFRSTLRLVLDMAGEELRKQMPQHYLGHLMRFANPADGGWAMPTMATMIRLLPAGFATRAYRSSDSMVFVVSEGAGRARVGEEIFELSAGER